jgi:hypothetical protein
LKIQLEARQVTYTTGLTISTLRHFVKLRRVARLSLTMPQKYSSTFLLSTKERTVTRY